MHDGLEYNMSQQYAKSTTKVLSLKSLYHNCKYLAEDSL